MPDYSPYQKKIIDRYYKNFDAIKHQQLSELATELYLAEGKKKDRLWKRVEEDLRKLEFPDPGSSICSPGEIPRSWWRSSRSWTRSLRERHDPTGFADRDIIPKASAHFPKKCSV